MSKCQGVAVCLLAEFSFSMNILMVYMQTDISGTNHVPSGGGGGHGIQTRCQPSKRRQCIQDVVFRNEGSMVQLVKSKKKDSKHKYACSYHIYVETSVGNIIKTFVL